MKKLCVLFLFPFIVEADPGAATRYLVSEPATMLDIGMIRLDDLTDEFERRVGLGWTEGDQRRWFTAEVGSRFYPDSDTIVVSFSVMNSEPNEQQMAEGCREAMGQMNIWLMKSLPGLFQHAGHELAPLPDGVYESLVDMFVIRCYFSSSRDTSEGRFWAYRKLGNLGERSMTIGKWFDRESNGS